MIECLLPSFEGPEPPGWLLQLVAEGVGGVVLFGSNVRDREQLAALTSALRAEQSELLIALDEEGGDVTRLHAATGSPYPGNAALGAVDDVELTERVAASIAAELAAAGVDLDFAPVADVNLDAANPVIGVRSFGADAALVARHVAAYVSGLQANGVAGCAKHFPGHGATDRDSHLELPTLTGDLADGLPPFRAAIAAGVQSIMTAHIRVPALGDEPATVNPRALALLRGELGYDRLVITDALEMKGLSETVGVEEGAVLALVAGADSLCLGHDLGDEATGTVVRAIVSAVRDGRLAEERLGEAAARVRRLAFSSGNVLTRDHGGRAVVGLEAARRALIVEGRVELTAPPLVVDLRSEPSIAAGRAAVSLPDFLPGAEVAHGTAPPARDGRQPVLVVRDAHRHPWQRDAVAAAGPDAVVVEVGLPVWRPAGVAGYLATHGAGRVNLAAAAERLRALRE